MTFPLFWTRGCAAGLMGILIGLAVTPLPGQTVLQSGVPLSGQAGGSNADTYYQIGVAAGGSLQVSTSGGTGDADLYVRFGQLPTQTVRDCASTSSSNLESCTIATTQSGTYFILIHGFQAYSGLTITATFSAAAPVASSLSFSAPSTTSVNQPVTLTISGRNSGAGPTNAFGYLSVEFRNLTGSGDGSQVNLLSASSGGTYTEFPKGTTIFDINGNPFPAQYLLSEYSLAGWTAGQTNTMQLQWTPTSPGVYVIEYRMALQISGAAYSRLPTNGGIDQGGFVTSSFTVTVNGPPQAASFAFTPSMTTVTAGQPMTLTVSGRNSGTGPANATGFLSIAFRQLVGTGDGAQVSLVSASNGGTYTEYPHGATIFDVNGNPLSAQYLLTEYSLNGWAASQTNTLQVQWIPTTAGLYVVEGRMALQVSGNSYSRLPTTGALDQQGNLTTQFIITVLPGPPVASGFSFTASTNTVTVGQPVTLTASGRNAGTGPTSSTGFLSIAFRNLAGTGDGAQVGLLSATNGGIYNEYPHGTTIFDINGAQIPAVYLLTEYSLNGWGAGQTNTLQVQWTPTTPGTYVLEGRMALQVSGLSYSRLPTSGPLDQQGTPTSQMTITVVGYTMTAAVRDGGGIAYPMTGGVVQLFDPSGAYLGNGTPTSANTFDFSNLVPGTGYRLDAIQGGIVIARTQSVTVPVTSSPVVLTVLNKIPVRVAVRADMDPLVGAGDSIEIEVRDPTGAVVDHGFTTTNPILSSSSASAYTASIIPTTFSGTQQYTGVAKIQSNVVHTLAFSAPNPTFAVTIDVTRDEMFQACNAAGAYRLTRRANPSAPDASRRAVILVHGFVPDVENCAQVFRPIRGTGGGAWDEWGPDYFNAISGDWSFMAGNLQAAGYEVWSYRWPSDLSIDSAGRILGRKLATEFGAADRVVLFGHSMGGLVGRVAAVRAGLPNIRVLTAGTPNLGSPYASGLASTCALLVGSFGTFDCSSKAVDEIRPGSASNVLFFGALGGGGLRGLEQQFNISRGEPYLDHVVAVAGEIGAFSTSHNLKWRQCQLFAPCDGLIEVDRVYGADGDPLRMHHQVRQNGGPLQDYDHGQMKFDGSSPPLPNGLLATAIGQTTAKFSSPSLATAAPPAGTAVTLNWAAPNSSGHVGAIVEIARDNLFSVGRLVDTVRTAVLTWTSPIAWSFAVGTSYFIRVRPVYSFYPVTDTRNKLNDVVVAGEPTAPLVFSPGTPVATGFSLTASSNTITIGQSVNLTVTGGNSGTGPTNTTGYMSIAFRSLTGTGDGAQVGLLSASNGGSYTEYPKGTTIFDVNGGQISAQYLLTEYSLAGWAVNQNNTLQVQWTPTVAGTFVVEGRMALQISGNSYSRLPTSGPTDQQGAQVNQLTVTVAPLPPTQLALTTQPGGGASGIALTTQPVVELRNAQNQPVGQSGVVVTVTKASGPGTLGGTLTATTNAQGRASFSGLTLTGPGTYTLTFSSSGLTPVTSQSVTVSSAPATHLAITTQPVGGLSGATLPTQPVVVLLDAQNTVVPQSGVVVTAAKASGPGTLGGTLAVSTDAQGQAVFTDLLLTGGGTYTLDFTAQSLTKATSQLFTISGTLAITSASPLPAGFLTIDYPWQLDAVGGTGTYAWSVSQGTLPPGLALAPSGQFSGFPSSLGTFNFTVQVTSGVEQVQKAFDLTIYLPPVVATDSLLPPATVGVPYSLQLQGSGGNGSYGWIFSGVGTLPPGLGISSSGLLSGTPTAGGRYPFLVSMQSAGFGVQKWLGMDVPAPDLVPSLISGPVTATPGLILSLKVSYSNAGLSAAPSGWVAKLYLSTDPTIDASDTYLQSRVITRALATGQVDSFNVTVAIPPAQPVGTYYYGVILDANQKVAEADETNNALASAATVDVKFLPDLQPTLVTGPLAGKPGGKTLVAINYVNNGPGAAPSGWVAKLYLSADQTITSADSMLRSMVINAPLAAGQPDSFAVNLSIPATFPQGIYYYGVILDANLKVAEGVESNNALSSAAPVDLRILPDLEPTFISGPATATAGGKALITTRYRNNGPAAAPSGWVAKLYLSTDPVINSADLMVRSQQIVTTLGVGQPDSLILNVTLPLTVPAGPWYYGVILDANQKVTEANETNNALASANIVTTHGTIAALTAGGDLGPEAVREVLNHIVGLPSAADWTVLPGGRDADCDGDVDSRDALIILNYLKAPELVSQFCVVTAR